MEILCRFNSILAPPNHQNRVLVRIWGRIGAALGRPGRILVRLGASWGRPAAPWRRLEGVFGASWGVIGIFWVRLGAFPWRSPPLLVRFWKTADRIPRPTWRHPPDKSTPEIAHKRFPESTKIHFKIDSERHQKIDRFVDRFYRFELGFVSQPGTMLAPCFGPTRPKKTPRRLQPRGSRRLQKSLGWPKIAQYASKPAWEPCGLRFWCLRA